MKKNEPWWKSAVLYQIYPRSFADSSGTGTGDLRGITEKLPYLADLGIDAIWISPFFESPMRDFGYDVQNHRNVDPLFGTNADFDALLARAHELGIRVLIDLVLSHCADTHAWFRACLEGRGSAYDDAFIWAEPAADGGPPNNWLSVFGGPAWTYHEGRNQYYLHNFLCSQPDLNYHHPMVREEALSIARYWLDKGVDGFRLDAINFCLHDPELRDNPQASAPDGQCVQLGNPYGTLLHVYDKNHPEVPSFLEELRAVMDSYEDRVTLGEIGASREASQSLMGEYTRPGRLNLCYSFDLLSMPFQASEFRQLIRRLAVEDDDSWGCWAFSNHDAMRAATRLDGPPEAVAPLSLAVLLSFRGTPCLYQGEELGLEEAEIPYDKLVDPYGIAFYPDFKGRDGCRTPMPWMDGPQNAGFCPDGIEPWLPIPGHHRLKAANLAVDESDSLYHRLRDLLAFRKAHPALCRGTMRLREADPRLLVFERIHGGQRAMCTFNLSPEAVEVDRPVGWDSLPGRQRGVSTSEGSERLRMAPWSWYIRIFEDFEPETQLVERGHEVVS